MLRDIVRSRATTVLSVTWLALAVGVGCADPCQKLAKKVCKCERTELEQQSCSRRVDEETRSHEPSEADENLCAELLDGCTCSKLAAGDLAACGLARP